LGFRLHGPSPISDTRGIDRGGGPRNEHIDDVRAAFVLCDLVKLPAEDAAEIVQSSPQVVRGRAHRARLMLRGFLDRLWSA